MEYSDYRDSKNYVVNTLKSGAIPNLNVSSSGCNSFQLYVKDRLVYLSVNSDSPIFFRLTGNLSSGDVGILTGYYADAQVTGKTTIFKDFEIWSLDEGFER